MLQTWDLEIIDAYLLELTIIQIIYNLKDYGNIEIKSP